MNANSHLVESRQSTAKALRRLAKSALVSNPTMALMRSLKRSALILNYHRVLPKVSPDSAMHERALAVSAEAFKDQLEYLAANFNCLPLPELIERLIQGKSIARLAAVTFDDGYADNFEYALPLLEHVRIPATVFVTSGFIGSTAVPWWCEIERLLKHRMPENGHSLAHAYFDLSIEMKKLNSAAQIERLNQLRGSANHGMGSSEFQREQPGRSLFMNSAQVRQLANSELITIGSHSATHPVLSTLSDEQARHEMVESRLALESLIKAPVRLLAYPFGKPGQASAREYSLAKACGYMAAFTTVVKGVRPGTDPFSVPRLPISSDDSFTDFKLKLCGFAGRSVRLN